MAKINDEKINEIKKLAAAAVGKLRAAQKVSGISEELHENLDSMLRACWKIVRQSPGKNYSVGSEKN